MRALSSRWEVEVVAEFRPEFSRLARSVQEKILALSGLLNQFGPHLGRPHVDTLYGSRHPNMKELRFRAARQSWRVAFAFDPRRDAILLVAGTKSSRSGRFYESLIQKADARFDAHLARTKDEETD